MSERRISARHQALNAQSLAAAAFYTSLAKGPPRYTSALPTTGMCQECGQRYGLTYYRGLQLCFYCRDALKAAATTLSRPPTGHLLNPNRADRWSLT